MAILFSKLFQDLLSKTIENESATNEQFAVDFLDFWMPEVWLFVIWEARALFLESRGPIVRISMIFRDFGVAPATKKEFCFESEMQPVTHFLW